MQKTALITGAGSGIGFEVARQLAQQDIVAIIVARGGKAEAAADLLSGEGLQSEPFLCDLSIADDRQRLCAFVGGRVGWLDILVNDAGIWLGTPSASDDQNAVTSEITPDTLYALFETNFFLPRVFDAPVAAMLKAAPAVRIVNVSSAHGWLTLHSDPQTFLYLHKVFGYGATKSAMNAHTVQLTYELRDTAIRVNSIHPGWVQTPMGGPEAMISPTDAAERIVRLATAGDDSPQGAFLEGDTVLPW